MSVGPSVDPIIDRISIDRGSRIALVAQIARQLTRLIATGVIEPGSFLPTTVSLGRHLGVNVHTVRAAYRQLMEDGLVSMRQGSRTVVLGYDRDRAGSYRENRESSFTIGVLFPFFGPSYAPILEVVSDESEIEGWLPVICRTRDYHPLVVSRHIDQLFSRNVDGIIVIDFDRPDEQVSGIFRSSAALRPLVFVDSLSADCGSMIVVDNVGAGFKATGHLIEHGHERIGLIDPAVGWGTSRLLAGSSQALAAAGLPLHFELVKSTADWSREEASKAAAQLLDLANPPTAIFCASDILALGAISAVEERGGRVPRDIAVIGHAETPLAALTAPSLSTTHLPARDLGREAIRTLRRAIDTGTDQPPVIVETTFVARESCSCSPTTS